jgi:hypothetical protein
VLHLASLTDIDVFKATALNSGHCSVGRVTCATC